MKTFSAILFIITFNTLFRETDEAPWRRLRPVFRGFDDGPELSVPIGGKKWSTWEKPAIATLFATDVDEPAAVDLFDEKKKKKLIRDVYSSNEFKMEQEEEVRKIRLYLVCGFTIGIVGFIIIVLIVDIICY